MAKKDTRFDIEVKESNGFSGSKIIVDSQTGVQYLYFTDGTAGGITLLVDASGRPMLSPTYMR
ncbi:MAG: DUF6440 family protein [Propionibacteriaceae bacterium]|jgi:hypothetical protein|nr:DUF6440 family protein [Propionibacteriaceae bacterium]